MNPAEETKQESDLILETGEEGTEENFVPEPDIHAEIASACNAYNTVAEIDEKLLQKDKARMIIGIRWKCLEIIAHNIDCLHNDIFPVEEEEN